MPGGSVGSRYELLPGYKFLSVDLGVAFGISATGDFLGVVLPLWEVFNCAMNGTRP